jgi:Zn-dependent peptidase ImmA (M78 family)/plasmid maintenance system antidote protein VapI
MTNASFMPDWAVPPGATVRALMHRKGVTTRDLSGGLRATAQDIENLLDGNYAINAEIAEGLAGVVGGSLNFWMTREAQYRASVERVEVAKSWSTLFPLTEMVRMGWIKSTADQLTQIHACLAFFGVGTTDEWFHKYSNAKDQAAFRTTSKFESSDGAVLAWLRKGELEAQKQACRKWNKQELQNQLPALRALTRLAEPEKFVPQLQDILNKCGVRIVILRPTKGCKAHGATFFSNGQPTILLSVRYLSDDQFWFTVFHEIGHLILHSETKRFVEGDGSSIGDEEDEANEFATSTLIPEKYLKEIQTLGANGRAVMRLAKDIGIAPGIVVGQMQHRKLLTFAQLNNLKQRYKWAE